jgi:hypothetical protein
MKGRAATLVLAAWLAATACCLAAERDEARVVLLAPEVTETWVGAGVDFEVELWVQGQFSGAPMFDVPDVPGLILVKSASRPVIASRRVGDQSWTIQGHEFTAYAQHQGEVTIPAFSVRFASKRRFDQPVSQHQLMTEPIGLRLMLPAGAGGHAGAIAAVSEIRIRESWDPESIEGLRVGDAVVRMVEQSADDYPAMLLPVPGFLPVDGVASYSGAPEISDREERGLKRARRVDTLTYVFEQNGRIVVPETVLRYWDPESEAWKQHSLAERRFEVEAVPIYTDPVPASTGATQRHWLVPATLLLTALLLISWFVFRPHAATRGSKSGPWREPALPPLNPLPRHRSASFS